MVDELTLILEAVGDMSGMAAWVAVGYLLLKLLTTACTCAMFAYIAVLVSRVIFAAIGKPVQTKVGWLVTSHRDANRLEALLKNASKSSYLADLEFEWLEEALVEKTERDGSPEFGGKWEKARRSNG